MKRAAVAALLLALAAPLYADYDAIERALTRRLGTPTWIPGFGIARIATWIIHPSGVHDIQLTVYENKPGDIDGAEMEKLVAREIPRGFSPMIRARSRNGQWTFIYAKPHGEERIELFVVAHDHEDTTLMRVDVEPDRITELRGGGRLVRPVSSR